MEAEESERLEGKKTVIDLIDRLDWLDAIAEAVQPPITDLFKSAGAAGQRIKDLLNGVWLGHPLHPVLTDVPIGAWTMAILLDWMPGRAREDAGLARAADAAVGLGLAGAVGSAVTGLTDWSDTYGRPRKVGVGHALGNVAATLLFTASFVARKRRDREAGRTLALLGYLVSLGAAYLGGHLVFGEQIGVDHTAGRELPKDWVPVLGERELAEGQSKKASAGDVPILLSKRGGRIFAIAETCAHQGGPLSEGKIEGDEVTCPWHFSRYDVKTGDVLNGPSTFPQPCFETRTAGGKIEVRAKTR